MSAEKPETQGERMARLLRRQEEAQRGDKGGLTEAEIADGPPSAEPSADEDVASIRERVVRSHCQINKPMKDWHPCGCDVAEEALDRLAARLKPLECGHPQGCTITDPGLGGGEPFCGWCAEIEHGTANYNTLAARLKEAEDEVERLIARLRGEDMLYRRATENLRRERDEAERKFRDIAGDMIIAEAAKLEGK